MFLKYCFLISGISDKVQNSSDFDTASYTFCFRNMPRKTMTQWCQHPMPFIWASEFLFNIKWLSKIYSRACELSKDYLMLYPRTQNSPQWHFKSCIFTTLFHHSLLFLIHSLNAWCANKIKLGQWSEQKWRNNHWVSGLCLLSEF
jgi:hypothetical protein